ncbi:hypothetical protein [Streptomyces sp. 1268]|uniref:hypothetical protein n=1 Tax=Streptomyces sp. 1268 TaxID=3231942 RepID=UPI0038D4AC67
MPGARRLVAEDGDPQHHTGPRVLRDLGGPRAEGHREAEVALGVHRADGGAALVPVGPRDRHRARSGHGGASVVRRVRPVLAIPGADRETGRPANRHPSEAS